MKSYFKGLVLAIRYPLIFVGIQITFIIAVMIYGVIHIILGYSLDSLEQMIMKFSAPLTIVSFILTFFISYFILRRKENIIERISFKPIKLKDLLLIMIITVTISSFIMCMIPILTAIFPQYNVISQQISNDMGTPMMIVNALVLAPIFEELLFRGLVFKELEKHTNIFASVITQGVIFGICHLNIVQGIYTCLLGMVMAVIYYWTNSIFSSVIMHIGFNMLGTEVLPKLFSGIGSSLLAIAGLSFVLFTAAISMLKITVRE